jgi:hypothetical protein
MARYTHFLISDFAEKATSSTSNKGEPFTFYNVMSAGAKLS